MCPHLISTRDLVGYHFQATFQYLRNTLYNFNKVNSANNSIQKEEDVPGSKPLAGNSSPYGVSSMNGFPSESNRVSVSGLNFNVPASAKAVAISGDATNP